MLRSPAGAAADPPFSPKISLKSPNGLSVLFHDQNDFFKYSRTLRLDFQWDSYDFKGNTL